MRAVASLKLYTFVNSIKSFNQKSTEELSLMTLKYDQNGTLPPIERKVLLTKHFDNSLSVYLFLEFEPKLGKSEKFNNQGKQRKGNKAFRIPFITKRQLKDRQALHRIFLKPQYKVCRGASIHYFRAFFSDVLSVSKISQPLG